MIKSYIIHYFQNIILKTSRIHRWGVLLICWKTWLLLPPKNIKIRQKIFPWVKLSENSLLELLLLKGKHLTIWSIQAHGSPLFQVAIGCVSDFLSQYTFTSFNILIFFPVYPSLFMQESYATAVTDSRIKEIVIQLLHVEITRFV